MKNNNVLTVTKLMGEVELDCGHLSDLERISNHPSYRKIIEIGEDAISTILENYNVIWVQSISEISGLNLDTTKYNINQRFNITKNWAIENGYTK